VVGVQVRGQGGVCDPLLFWSSFLAPVSALWSAASVSRAHPLSLSEELWVSPVPCAWSDEAVRAGWGGPVCGPGGDCDRLLSKAGAQFGGRVGRAGAQTGPACCKFKLQAGLRAGPLACGTAHRGHEETHWLEQVASAWSNSASGDSRELTWTKLTSRLSLSLALSLSPSLPPLALLTLALCSERPQRWPIPSISRSVTVGRRDCISRSGSLATASCDRFCLPRCNSGTACTRWWLPWSTSLSPLLRLPHSLPALSPPSPSHLLPWQLREARITRSKEELMRGWG
jgi:hypothetical protein